MRFQTFGIYLVFQNEGKLKVAFFKWIGSASSG
jgi:hypothetical protein